MRHVDLGGGSSDIPFPCPFVRVASRVAYPSIRLSLASLDARAVPVPVPAPVRTLLGWTHSTLQH